MVIGSLMLALLALLLVGSVVYLVIIYNGLVALKNNAAKAWSNIDVLLKQRFDEIPKLVAVCEGYMKHERRTLEAVIAARARIPAARGEREQLQAQGQVSHALHDLFAVVEGYPNLKADAAFRQLQSRISELENQIADRREFFNESVNLYNIRIEQFPDVLVARAFNYAPRSLWKIAPADRADPTIGFAKPEQA
jgi:LemA protein